VGHAASSNMVSELNQRMFAQIEWGTSGSWAETIGTIHRL
jgi:hypothetical protein